MTSTGNTPTTTTSLPVPVAQPSARSTLAALGAALLALDDERQYLAEQGDYQALLHGLAAMRVLRTNLQVLERSTEADAARLLEDLPREGRARRWVLDVGLVEVRNQYPSRTWEDARLVPDLVRAALDPEGTGELPDSPMEAAARVAEALRSCARLEWRTGDPTRGQPGLRTYGLDPNEYRSEAGDPRPVIAITTPKETPQP